MASAGASRVEGQGRHPSIRRAGAGSAGVGSALSVVGLDEMTGCVSKDAIHPPPPPGIILPRSIVLSVTYKAYTAVKYAIHWACC
jgi:hypothetical protein